MRTFRRFKENTDRLRQIADDLGIETLTIADLKETFTDFVGEFIKKGYRIEACDSNSASNSMSCYFIKDGNSFYGIEMYKEFEEYYDTLTIAEMEFSSSNFRNGTKTDSIKFYYKNDNHIYNSSEDLETAYNEFKKALGY